MEFFSSDCFFWYFSYTKKSTENNGNKKLVFFMTILNDCIYEHLLKYKTLTMCET